MQRIINKINAARSVAVLPHINADADALGSCYAMAYVLRKMGKTAVCYLSEPDKELAFLDPEYTVYDGNTHCGHDLCVCLDCGDKKRLGGRVKLFEEIGNSVNIDHHKTNDRFADENYVDAAASATGEILYTLFKRAGWSVDSRAAQFLYAAICSDTGCFKYSNVTPATLRTAADLLEYGFDHAETARLMFDTYSPAVAKFKGRVMESIKSYAGGRISLCAVDEAWVKECGLTEQEVPNIVDIPRCIEGTEIAVALRRKDDEIRVNLRSNSEADVSAVALKFGGGGHVKAAGCGIKNADMAEAERLIVDACKEELS